MERTNESRWLKKYTKLEFLRSTLSGRQLHLGNPKDWADQNDGELIRLYSRKSGLAETRATCLTSAPDRFHFWAIFGGGEKGVCLWFGKAELMRDMAADQTLRSRPVQYKTVKRLKTLKRDEVPFTKREQYADEREFRVIRDYPSLGPVMDGFVFSASSLKRIYLNPWLIGTKLKQEELKLAELLRDDFEHVVVRQNRALKHCSWINAAKIAVENAQ